MNKKGQIAFESLLILLVIMTGAIAITSFYMQTHGDTLAISAARTEVLRQIGEKNENIYIESIQMDKSLAGTIIISIKTSPKKTETDFNKTTIIQKAKIASSENITDIRFE
ncbi:Uncharacterised protein [uncultured archaeon]|nr:Uncharacterised protein [uncultured archaeon]